MLMKPPHDVAEGVTHICMPECLDLMSTVTVATLAVPRLVQSSEQRSRAPALQDMPRVVLDSTLSLT